MRKLSEIRGEDALDVLADLLDPVSEICVDEKVKELFKERKKIKLVAYILKEHKKSILTILALLEGVKPDEYKPSLAVLPVLILQLLNDPDVIAVFQSAGLGTFSGSATENTQETEKE